MSRAQDEVQRQIQQDDSRCPWCGAKSRCTAAHMVHWRCGSYRAYNMQYQTEECRLAIECEGIPSDNGKTPPAGSPQRSAEGMRHIANNLRAEAAKIDAMAADVERLQ